MSHSISDLFRQAWGNFPTGVSVVTFYKEDGSIHGLTASAISSVSLTPPLVLVCVDEKARSRQLLAANGRFVMNFLAKGQEDLCWHFANRQERGVGPFTYKRSRQGFPVLDGCYAWMDCRVAGVHPAGDHAVFIGEVEEIAVNGGTPLVFHQGGFAELKPYLG